jgi:hypothetical protein
MLVARGNRAANPSDAKYARVAGVDFGGSTMLLRRRCVEGT